MYVLDPHAAFSLEPKEKQIMDAQDIIKLIEFFRNSRNTEMEYEIENLQEYMVEKFDELFERLTEYFEFNYAETDKNEDLPF